MEPREIVEVVEAHTKERASMLKSYMANIPQYLRERKAITDVFLLRRRRPSEWHYLTLSKLLFPLTVCPYTDIFDAVVRRDPDEIEKRFNECVEFVEENPKLPLYVEAFLSTPMALTLATALLGRHKDTFYQPGKMYTVYGERGCGKTTLTFWSVAVPLLAIGIDMKTVKEIAKSLWVVANTKKYVELMYEVTQLAEERRTVPFVVVDDAGVSFSKYLWAPGSTTAEKKLVARIGELEQIAREGVDLSIYISNPDMVIKPLRTSFGTRISGISVDTPRWRYTVWIVQSPKTEGVKEYVEAFSTVHPLMKTPDDLLAEWTKQKLEARKKILEEVATLGEAEASRRVGPSFPS